MRHPLSNANGSWLALGNSPSQPRLRLFCFPYAGAGASIFRPWSRALPQGVDLALVQLPGRETRIDERPFTDMASLVGPLTQALRPHLDVPSVFFGHSMGALVAFEVARRLRAEGWPGPARLLASGCRAPHKPYHRKPVHHLPDEEVVAEVTKFGGTPGEILAHPELMALLLPILRADLQVCETYRYAPGPPLECGITVYGGLRDQYVTREELEAWQDQTRGHLRLRMFDGAHFFMQTAQRDVLQALSSDLLGHLPA